MKPPSASLQAALLPFFIMGFTALAVKLQLDTKALQFNIYALSSASAALVASAYAWALTHFSSQGKRLAEDRVKGIASPNGPEAPVTVILNDPASPAPPIVMSHPELPPIPLDPPPASITLTVRPPAPPTERPSP